METLTRLAPMRGRDAPDRSPRQEPAGGRRWHDGLLGRPFTLLLALMLLLMVLPGLLRARSWERFGDH